MTRLERAAVDFVKARRAELDAKARSWLGGCEYRCEGDWETGSQGYDSCIREPDCEPADYCDACKQAAAAYAEYQKLRGPRRNALRRLERAVAATNPARPGSEER